MKRLQCTIDEFAIDDFEKDRLTMEINENIHGKIRYEELSDKAQIVMDTWEQREIVSNESIMKYMNRM